VAGGLTLFLFVIGFGFLVRYLVTGKPSSGAGQAVSLADIEAPWERGRKALANGDFGKAARELDAANALADQHPKLLTSSAGRRLANVQQEAALLNRWARQPLDEALKEMAPLKEERWQALMDLQRGKAFFFDVDVRRGADGTYHLEHHRPAAAQLLKLDVQNLKLLHKLPLSDSRRLIFGARLADVRREPGPPYLTRLEPDSGVLLTEPEAASICCFQPVDASFQEVMDRQARWVAEPP